MHGRASAWSQLGALLAVGDASAQIDEPPARTLTGALKRIKASGVVRIGYRAQAVPFSYEAHTGQPWGYSIDLCEAIVEDIAREIGVATLRTEYRRVTPSDRIEQVVDGRIDLECGASTNTAQRRTRVAFSPLTFVSGTRLLVQRGGPVHSLRDLAGRRVVVVRGTTNADVMRQLAAGPLPRSACWKSTTMRRRSTGLATGQAEALAADDILIIAYLAEHGLQRQYAVVGELLSYEPYGIMFARDDASLAAVVDASLSPARRDARDPLDLRQVVHAPPAVRRAPRRADEPSAGALVPGSGAAARLAPPQKAAPRRQDLVSEACVEDLPRPPALTRVIHRRPSRGPEASHQRFLGRAGQVGPGQY